MKDIVIVANFAGNLQGADNNRFAYLANQLSANAKVELVTSTFDHSKKAQRSGQYSDFSYRVTLLQEPGYPKNVCLRRFYSHAVFGKSVAEYLRTRKKPDLIYCAVPSLGAAKAAADYARENNVRFIVDIQDLWPEAFKMVFRVPVISDIIFAPMKRTADAVYKQADEIVAVSRTYCERAIRVNTKCSTSHTVFLGTRLADFDANVSRYKRPEKPVGERWLAYCGTLGNSYDLTSVLDALALIRRQGMIPPKFIVMGDGPREAEFKAYAEKLDVNVQFTGRLPYAEMCGLLCACDMTVNPITKGAAGSIINKHADYAASGLPVLNTQESPEYRSLVDEYEIGLNCENGNAKDLAEKMMRLLGNPDLCLRMGANARRCAEECFDREYSYRRIEQIIFTE